MWQAYPCPIIQENYTTDKSAKTSSITAEASPISISEFNYGPNPVALDIGEIIYFKFMVAFNDTPPETFDCTINIKDRNNTVIKALNQIVTTKGQSNVYVEMFWDGKLDSGKSTLTEIAEETICPDGGYGPHWIIDYGTGTYETDLCSGIQIRKVNKRGKRCYCDNGRVVCQNLD